MQRHINSDQSYQEWQKFKVTTRTVIISASISAVIFAAIFFMINHPASQIMWPITLAMPIWYVFCYWVSVKGSDTLSRILVSLGGGAFVITLGYIFGLHSGGNLWIFAFAVGVFAIFPYKRKNVGWIIALIIMVCGMLLAYYGPKEPILGEPFSPFQERVLYTSLWAGIFLFILVVSYAFYQSTMKTERALDKERSRSDNLLLNIFPEAIAQKLKSTGENFIAENHEEVSVLFADIVGFTPEANRASPDEIVDFLNNFFHEIDKIVDKYQLEKIKTIGDAYMVAAGIPQYTDDHVQRIANIALELRELANQSVLPSGRKVELRIGIATGPVVAGVIGTKKFSYDLWGDTVNVAARMESHGISSRIQVTEKTYELLREDYLFVDRGEIEIKGFGKLRTWWLVGRK